MKIVICLVALFCLSGCAQSGYSRSYIISDASKDLSHPVIDAKEL